MVTATAGKRSPEVHIHTHARTQKHTQTQTHSGVKGILLYKILIYKEKEFKIYHFTIPLYRWHQQRLKRKNKKLLGSK